MAHDLAERIVQEAAARHEAQERDASLVCRFVLVCDMDNTLSDQLSLRHLRDGRLAVRYKTLSWPALSLERAAQVVRMVFVSLYDTAYNRHGPVDSVELQLEHRGGEILRIPWSRCSDIDTDDIVAGHPAADNMINYLWGCVEMAALGLVPT